MKNILIYVVIIMSVFLLTACPPSSTDDDSSETDYTAILTGNFWVTELAECDGNALSKFKTISYFNQDKTYSEVSFLNLESVLSNPCPNVTDAWRNSIQATHITNNANAKHGTWSISGNILTVPSTNGTDITLTMGDTYMTGYLVLDVLAEPFLVVLRKYP